MARHPAPPSTSRSWPRWILVAVTALLVLIVGGPWVYIHVIEGKPAGKLALSPSESTPSTGSSSAAGVSATDSPSGGAAPAATGDSLDGSWTVADGSLVGYRVKEVLFGQHAEAVGRTKGVAGVVAVSGDAVTSATFTADLTSVKSDKNQRDNQFRGRIMETDTFPTATFRSTAPIAVPASAGAGKLFTAKATGELTLHGTKKAVAFQVSGRKSATGFEVTAQIPIVFADFGIADPSFGPAQTEDHGVLEILIKLTPKA